MDFNGFKLEINEISVLSFNRPVNVLSTPVITGLLSAFKVLSEVPHVKVLIITGSGRTFLAGADIKEMSGMGKDEALEFARNIHKAMDAVENFPRPTIAAVNGFALGGGCELALSCDIVIAADSAVFGQPELSLGITPGAGATQRLKMRIGISRAKELIFTGRKITAQEALSIGLANRVVKDERLSEEAMATAREISAHPVQCLEGAKRLIGHGTLKEEIDEFARMFEFKDRKILMERFLSRKNR